MRTQCCAALQTGQCNDCPITAPMRPQPRQVAQPAWHDAPTCAGVWWSSFSNVARQVTTVHIEKGSYVEVGARWYGPIPPDGDKP